MGRAVRIVSADVLWSRNDAASARYGMLVERATAALPQTATQALFTVTGRCIVTQILGQVTTVIQTQANLTKLQMNPTATGTSVDVCADLSITAMAVATLFGITGTFAKAMLSGLAIPSQAVPFIAQPGTIDLVCAASNTGNVSWSIRYVPFDTDALITAA
jgi:hypothetical protein